MVAGIQAYFKGKLTVKETVDATVDGAKALAVACGILILAWSLGTVVDKLGTANFIVQTTKDFIPPFLVPTMMFVIPGVVAFATGTSWGANAIIMPLAIPMAYQFGAPMLPTIGAVLTGCVLGDHCSPISDTTIMSSTASAADHIDHVNTQLPYALIVGAVAVVFGFLPAGFALPYWMVIPLLLAGIVALYVIVSLYGKSVEKLETVEAVNKTTN